MKKILITGFKPFNGQRINPSEILATELANSHIDGLNVDMESLVLPVSFQNCFKPLLERLTVNEKNYKFILMLGQATGRNYVSLERVALNWIESNIADEDDQQPPTGPINSQASKAIMSNLPLEDWSRHLSSVGPTKTSLNAGGYVCNYLYFQTLLKIQSLSNLGAAKIPALFVHLPALPEQMPQTETTNSTMQLSVQNKILSELLRLI
jgi:pyroglutamyl-peptidase